MNKKLISTLSVLALLIIILVAGGIYIFVIQRGDISERQQKLDELNKTVYDPVELDNRYQELARKSAELDSTLANREFNIPQNISSIKFYDFINKIVANFPKETTVNLEYLRQAPDKQFFFHEYKLAGGGNYNDVYKMVYAIEQSKELKKISKLSLTNLVKIEEGEVPLFLVNFELIAQVYFASDNRFAPAESVENNLATVPIYDAFYPLIRNEIPPNLDNLLDVQGARLLALIPEGAFVADNKGNTYLVWEGEQVYLGYLTKIDYDNNSVSFILNKGGIIEQVTLQLDKNLDENLNKK